MGDFSAGDYSSALGAGLSGTLEGTVRQTPSFVMGA